MTAALSNAPTRSLSSGLSQFANLPTRPRPAAREDAPAATQVPSAKQAIDAGTARALVAIEARVSRTVRTAQGEETETYAFSIKAEADLFDVSPEAEATADAATDPNKAPAPTALDRLRAQFTPEKTAGRILDFALAGFANSQIFADQGNTESGRQAFSNLMSDAIDQGFREARALFGDLPEQTEKELAETATRIQTGLQSFVRNGLDPKKAVSGGTYDRARGAQFSTRVDVSASYSRTVYDTRGAAAAADPTSQSRLLAVA